MEGTVVVVLDPVLVFAILACFPLVDELLDFLVLVRLGERIDSRKVEVRRLTKLKEAIDHQVRTRIVPCTGNLDFVVILLSRQREDIRLDIHPLVPRCLADASKKRS